MPNKANETTDLKKSIARSHLIVNAVVALTIGTYIVWFWLLREQSLATETETWGQLGDYVGGLLNPVVAYFAFYWLTKSVALQKEELAETRRALEETSNSQAEQAIAATKSVRVSALTALINSAMTEVQVQRMQIQFLLDQASRHHSGAARGVDGCAMDSGELQIHLQDLNQKISERMSDRWLYEEELRQLLQASREAT